MEDTLRPTCTLLVRVAKRIHEANCDRMNCNEHCKGNYQYETANEVIALVRAEQSKDAASKDCGCVGECTIHRGFPVVSVPGIQSKDSTATFAETPCPIDYVAVCELIVRVTKAEEAITDDYRILTDCAGQVVRLNALANMLRKQLQWGSRPKILAPEVLEVKRAEG